MKYKQDYTGVDKKENLKRDFCNIQNKIKDHFNTHTHKNHVMKIEESIRANQIQMDSARDGGAAAMRCARICFILFKKGRPFSDYPAWLPQ